MSNFNQLKTVLDDISNRYSINKEELYKLYIKEEETGQKVFEKNIKNAKSEIIFTDGSCQKKMCSLSVFFGINDKRNVGYVLDVERPTNQKAELYAILKAIEIVDTEKSYLIYTDSQYSINCITKWNRNWIKNGWKTSKGGTVLNQEIIKPILKLLKYKNVKFKHVRSHQKAPEKHTNEYMMWYGNMMCDKMAQNAITKFNGNKIEPPTGENDFEPKKKKSIKIYFE